MGNGMIAVPPGRATLSDRRTRRGRAVELALCRPAAFPVARALRARATGRRPGTGPGDRLPVACVSRWDAVRFRDALSPCAGRTPAYRFRAGPTGPRYGNPGEIGRYRGDSHEHVHEAGGRSPDPWGLHDVPGNVRDRCRDVYDAEVCGARRALRGGGWFGEHRSRRASARRRSLSVSPRTVASSPPPSPATWLCRRSRTGR